VLCFTGHYTVQNNPICALRTLQFKVVAWGYVELNVWKGCFNYYRNGLVNINRRDVERHNVVNNVDKSSLWAPWQMARTKTHRTSQNAEYTKKQQTLGNNYFCFLTFINT